MFTDHASNARLVAVRISLLASHKKTENKLDEGGKEDVRSETNGHAIPFPVPDHNTQVCCAHIERFSPGLIRD